MTKQSEQNEEIEKKRLVEDHIKDLDRRIWNIQDEMIEMGNNIISVWLSDADSQNIFEEMVDWLLGPEAQKQFEFYSGVMAIESVKYAIYQFKTDQEDNWVEKEEEQGNNNSKLYEDVRAFFNV